MSDMNRVPWSGDAPASWDDVVWPEWVPERVRREVAHFWGQNQGRRPKHYAECANSPYNHTPALGERVRLRLCGTRWAEGRYVHAWNNIGRVVDECGVVHCVSTCGYVPGAYDAFAASAAVEGSSGLWTGAAR